jgi:hypothetical protein
VSMHRLVQAVVSDQMPSGQLGQWKAAASALIEAAIRQKTGKPDSWSACSALIAHARTALIAGSAGIKAAEYG